MSSLLDVHDDVRAEIGDEEADRLLAGSAPDVYDCTSCRTPGNAEQEPTSTVLFVGGDTAVLAFAHAKCIPSQVVPVSEEQLEGAVQSITGETSQSSSVSPDDVRTEPGQAVLGVTCGLVIVDEQLYPALVVEPTGGIARPGTDGPGDDFLPLMIEQGFVPVTEVGKVPSELAGWSVLMVSGELHAVLQPGLVGSPATAWWQAHQPLPVSDEWRACATQRSKVLLFAAPSGAIGQQPREDLMRDALDKAATRGQLVAAMLPLSGT